MTGILIHAKHLQAEVKNKEKSARFLADILKTQLHKLQRGIHYSSLGTWGT